MKSATSFIILCLFFLNTVSANEIDDIELIDFKTKQVVTLSKFDKTKPSYIKLWATWCKPCMEQMPHFQDLQEEYGDKINILAVNININETMDYISDVISENSLSMPILLDKEGKLSEALGLVGTPYSVLINTDNKIVYTTHESNSVLDTFVAKLANGEKLASDHDKALSSSEKMSIIEPWSKGRHTLFFTATWCDWYLKESRPNMASNCKKIQSNANELKDLSEAKSVHGFVNHLWTDEKALNDFTELYEIDYPVEIDENGVLYTHFNIRSIPTMLIVEDGKEVERINAEQIITLLEK